jgi:hypothetical protein
MDSLAKRERKAVVFYAAPTEKPKSKEVSFVGGDGIELGEYPLFCGMLDKYKSTDEKVKNLHHFLFGLYGRKLDVKKNIRKFSGFPQNTSREDKISSIAEKKSVWTVSFLKSILEMCGLDKSGSRDYLILRLVDYMFCPSVRKSPSVDRKSRKSVAGKKRKRSKHSAGQQLRKKKVTAYGLFIKENYSLVKAENPALNFGELSKLAADRWRALSNEEQLVRKYVPTVVGIIKCSALILREFMHIIVVNRC